MKTGRDKDDKPPAMPFQVDHKLGVDITTQVANGLREAILSGFYKPGDVLPNILAFKHGLHVSMRVLQPAYRILKKEGLISPRRRLGTVVVGPRADVLHGRVVIVRTNDISGYYDAAQEAVLSRRLNAAGYAVSSVSTTPLDERGDDADKERINVRQLAAALRQSTSLAVVMGADTALVRAVAAAGTPFFTIGRTRSGTTGCVGFATFYLDSALPGVLARLRERGVRSLVQIGVRRADLMDAEALRAACKSYAELLGRPRHVGRGTQEEVMRWCYELFRKRYRTKADLPDAFLFTDDYLARGALLALLAAGIRTGRDVLVITLALKGNMPLHPDPIDLLLYDPARDADAIADALIAYLDSGVAPGTITLENTFVAGEVARHRACASPQLRLLSPADGEAVDLATPALTRWLRRLDAPQTGAGPVDYMALERQGKERSLAKEIPLHWEGPPDIRYTVELVREGAPWDCIRRIVTGTVCGVTNLRLGATYRWRVVAEDGTASDSFSFTTSDTPPRLITVGGISNVRDIGGWKVPGGRVRQGMVYRGGELERNMVLTDEGRRIMAEELGIRTDVDLRREVALESSPIGSARLVRIVMNAYAELVNDFGPACRSFFDLLCDPSVYPVYVHCFGGADRTGSVILVLNAALGVADSDLLLDYELTSLSIWGERSRSLDLFQDFLAALRPFGRPGDSLCLQCRGFLASLGFTDAHLARLRALLVEEDSHA